MAETDFGSLDVSAAEIVLKTPMVCEPLVRPSGKQAQGDGANKSHQSEAGKTVTFDINKAEQAFDYLLVKGGMRLLPGHRIPPAEELKNWKSCKYHNMWNHTTADCVKLRDLLQEYIGRGLLLMGDRTNKQKEVMGIDKHPFLDQLSINMMTVNVGAPKTPRTKIELGEACQPKGKLSQKELEAL